jgi:hypothetical protein
MRTVPKDLGRRIVQTVRFAVMTRAQSEAA